MCDIIPAPQSAPLFVIPSHSDRLRPVLKSQFVSVLPDRLQSAGIPQANLFRGHSFRRGGTSWAFSCGIPGELIQVFGDWHSDAYKCYLEISLPLRLRVSQGMAFGLSTSKSSIVWLVFGGQRGCLCFLFPLSPSGRWSFILINLSLCQTVCLRVFIFSTVFEEYPK